MCFHPNDTTAEYRGVCKKCKEVTTDKWVEVPDGNHQLTMIHELTNEAKEWWKNVEENIPNWTSFRSDGKTSTFSKYLYDENHKHIDTKKFIINAPPDKCFIDD
uniref:Uncharacterized protein n=1 Tax=Marseillevirus LCMAC201 TaxID=2506605 RepID=A0A481YXM8_9VIRU|nr:MAG: hypothetical protein LCMAC201_02340 [Marseillevirus LCMAC201]